MDWYSSKDYWANQVEPSTFEDPHTAEAFDECFDRVLSKPPIDNSNTTSYCPRTFDSWACWSDTPAGQSAFVPCPSFIEGFRADSKLLYLYLYLYISYDS